jgi:hypothetical protein
MNRGFASVIAVPAWARFMSAAMRGGDNSWFEMPGSLVQVKICRLSGMQATGKCNLPVWEPAPYDPNHPELLATSTGTMRPGDVYEDVMPADRVPPPCTLPHGEPAPGAPTYYDPSLSLPPVQRAVDSMQEPSTALPAIQPSVPDPSRPVTPPPAFMTERPPTRVTTMPPPTETRPRVTPAASVPPPAPAVTPAVNIAPPEQPAEKPAPPPAEKPAPKAVEKPATDPDVANPIIPGATEKPAPAPEQPADGPIVPGAKVEKTPPPPPVPRKPPQD